MSGASSAHGTFSCTASSSMPRTSASGMPSIPARRATAAAAFRAASASGARRSLHAPTPRRRARNSTRFGQGDRAVGRVHGDVGRVGASTDADEGPDDGRDDADEEPEASHRRRMARLKALPWTGVRLKPARMKKKAATTPSTRAKLLVSSVSRPMTTRSMRIAQNRCHGVARGSPTAPRRRGTRPGVMMLRGSRASFR